MRLLPVALLFSVPVLVLSTSGASFAACSVDGSITFAITCDGDFGPNGTATVTGSKLTITGETFDDPNDGASSFSRVVLKAGDEASSAIDIAVELVGTTLVDSHNSAAVYLLTKKGDISIDIGADVTLDAQQSGVFAKADNGGGAAGGNVIVTNSGTITAGTITNGSFSSEGIRVRALQGAGTIYNYGSVTSTLGRGLRIDASSVIGGDADGTIVNTGAVDAWLDAAHIYAQTGSSYLENTATGVLVSRSQRGAVSSSDFAAASMLNAGQITGAAAGVLVWGATDATLENSGTITAAALDGDGSNDFLHFGAQVWSTTSGATRLINNAGGEIVARDGWAAWVLSTDGDLTIDNAGTMIGKSTAIHVGGDKIEEQYNENPALDDYAGAVGGNLTLANSGVISADQTNSFQYGMGLVSLFGYDLDAVSISNLAGGIIGSGFDVDTDFSIGALTSLSPDELGTLAAAASSGALSLGLEAQSLEISNAGLLVGRVNVATPMDVFGDGPSPSAAATFDNSGLWLTSGLSRFQGIDGLTIANSGTIFTLGETTLTGDIENSGVIRVYGTDSVSGQFSLNGAYVGQEGGAFVLALSADGSPLVALDGTLSGQTEVFLSNFDGFDWQTYVPQEVITTTDATSQRGAESFVLATPVHGLVQYNLEFDEGELAWALSAQLSEESTAEIAEASSVIGESFTQLSSGILNRTDDLRGMSTGDMPTSSLGYMQVETPMDDAMAALTPPPVDTRLWLKAGGAFGAGGSYGLTQSAIEFGVDTTTTIDSRQVSIGAFATLSNSSFNFEGDSSAGVDGRSAGVYGSAVSPSGFFVSGVAAVEVSDIGLTISGEAADVSGLTLGSRFDAGYRAELGGVVVEPSFAVMASHSSMSSFSMSGTTVVVDDSQNVSTESRLRLMRRFAGEAMDVTPFLVLNLGTKVTSGGEVSVEGVSTSAQAAGIYGGLSLGIGLDSPDGVLSGFVRSDLSATTDSYLASFRIGGSRRF